MADKKNQPPPSKRKVLSLSTKTRFKAVSDCKLAELSKFKYQKIQILVCNGL